MRIAAAALLREEDRGEQSLALAQWSPARALKSWVNAYLRDALHWSLFEKYACHAISPPT